MKVYYWKDRKKNTASVSNLPPVSLSYAAPLHKHIQINSKTSLHSPWICKPATGSINIQFI